LQDAKLQGGMAAKCMIPFYCGMNKTLDLLAYPAVGAALAMNSKCHLYVRWSLVSAQKN
jgi:hypothetical protein